MNERFPDNLNIPCERARKCSFSFMATSHIFDIIYNNNKPARHRVHFEIPFKHTFFSACGVALKGNGIYHTNYIIQRR